MIIAAMIITAWLTAAVITSRYVGYEWNKRLLNGHQFQSICHRCICSSCGKNSYDHTYRLCPSSEWFGMHPAAGFGALGLSILIWPAFWTYVAQRNIRKAMGWNPDFFVPAPEIRSKEEKAAIEAAEREARIAELEIENLRLEKELGMS